MKLCDNCGENSLLFVKTDSNKRCEILSKLYTPSKIETGIYPNNSDIEITLSTTKFSPGDKIFYWAAEPKNINKSKEILSGDDAYKIEKTKNYGCCKVNKLNKIVFKICAPQCYKEAKTIWPKHLHFIVKKFKKDEWDIEKMYTVLSVPVETDILKTKCLKYTNIYLTPMQVKLNWKKDNFYMVYALDKKYKSLTDLPEYKKLKHIRLPWDQEVLKVPEKIKKNIPLVVYCGNKTCNAGKKLIMRLVEMSYENIFYMPDGMEGFSKESRKIFLNQ